MNIDVEFSIWFAQFQYLDSFFSFISTRWFAAILVLLAGVYFYHVKQLKIFVFICIATSLGDLTGNILKELLSDTRPCYGYSEIFIEEGLILKAVSYTHLTLPTIYSV